MDMTEHQAWWNQQLAMRQAEYERALAAEKAAAELKAREEAQKAADFAALKGLVDKVYFAYTLQRADDAELTIWTQQLTDGATPASILSGIRSGSSSMYFGAGAETSINNAYQTLFGRNATAAEKAALIKEDHLAIPGLIALQAVNADAETMGLRMQFSQAVKDYYKGAEIPLTYGVPMMKAKEQMLTLKAGEAATGLVENAVREMGDFLAEWSRVISKPGNAGSDVESPKREYFFEDADTVGVAFYEPANGNSNGRIMVTFDEPVDWSAMDINRDGRLEIFKELDIITSNPRIFGDNPTVVSRVGVNTLIINLGENAETPLYSGGNADGDFFLGDTIAFVSVSDYAGNSGAALFALTANAKPFDPDAIIPTEFVPPGATSIVRVGDRLILTFDEPLHWPNWDKNGDGRIALDTDNNGSLQSPGEMQIMTSRANMFGAGAVVENYGSQQMTVFLGQGHNYAAGDQLVTIGTMDKSGNTANLVFAEPVPTTAPTDPGSVDSTAPGSGSIERVGDRLLLGFSETLNWRAWDKNGDGRITLDTDNNATLAAGAELQILTSRPSLFGAGAVVESYSSDQMTLNLGSGHTYRGDDQLIFVKATDAAGNSANVLFTEGETTTWDTVPPVPTSIRLVGDRLLLAFDESLDWSVWDKNGDKRITLDTDNDGTLAAGAELRMITSRQDLLGTGAVVESYSNNQMTIKLGTNHMYRNSDQLIAVGATDVAGNVADAFFTEGGTPIFIDETPPAPVSIKPVGDRLLLTFSERLDWSVWDKNNDGKISLDLDNNATLNAPAEMRLITSRQGLLGTGAEVESYSNNQMTIRMGAGQSYRNSDQLIVVGAKDTAGNTGDALFTEGAAFLLDTTPPGAVEARSIGDRLFLTFTEAIDWSKLDTNGNKQVTLGLLGTTGSEGYFQAASTQALGNSPVIESYSSNQAVIRIGANSTYDPGDEIVLMNILDLSGNMAHVKFAEPDTGAGGVPVPSPVTRNSAVFVGDRATPAAGHQVVLEFNQNINWGLLDKNANGVISVSYLPSTGVPAANAELTIYTPEPTMLGTTVTVVSAYSNQITLQLGAGTSYGPGARDLNADGDTTDAGEQPADRDDDIMIIGVTDMFGNVINGVFTSPF